MKNTNPTMTLRELKKQLASIDPKYDDVAITVWLPGSRVDLASVMLRSPGKDGELLIEGNVRRGSALDSEPSDERVNQAAWDATRGSTLRLGTPPRRAR